MYGKGEDMIELTDINGDLGEFCLRDINLTVNEGEYLALLGPTGAGKTVLIEYIAGIHNPNKGSIKVDGEDITNLFMEDRNIGYVPQDYALFPNLTVEKNISYGLEARRMQPEQLNSIVSEMITRLEIDYIKHRMPLHLSGGEKQRVALGRALATKPKVLLLDEPLSALDENLRTEMARELRQIQRDSNGTFIHVCHNFEEAADVADRVVIMDNGRIIQVGTLKEIMEYPKNEFVARFLKSQNIFKGVSDGSVLNIENIVLVKKNDCIGNVVVAVRPENITIVRPDDGKESNIFQGKVRGSVLKPYFQDVCVDIGISIVMYTMDNREFNEGEEVKVRIPPEKIIVMGES